jgi:hypothetical protein
MASHDVYNDYSFIVTVKREEMFQFQRGSRGSVMIHLGLLVLRGF